MSSRRVAKGDRVQLVALLWDVRNAARQSGDAALRVVHFNLLLSDPRYRREMLDRARLSRSQTLRRLAEEAARIDHGQSLKPEEVQRPGNTPEAVEAADSVTEAQGKDTGKGKRGRWAFASLAALALGGGGLAVANQWLGDSGPRIEQVGGSLHGDIVWQSDRVYRLTDQVFVEAGSTLTIEPGTRVEGERGSALVVTRDATINARGEAYNPVVFTSAQPEAERRAGDWGGLVLLGNAPINTGTGSIEGIREDDPRGSFGGSDRHDSCGYLQYARIEYAGYEISANNELNGLTIGGCGDATILRYIQVHAGLDDGIEFFGGTANLSHAVITDADDDSLDWDRGWQGNAQFLVIRQSPGIGDNGFEADNLKADHHAQPRSEPTIANVTMLGSGDPEGAQRGMTLRRGTGLDLRNALITGFPGEAIDIRDVATVEQINRAALRMDGVVLAQNPNNRLFADESGEADDDGGFDEAAYFTGTGGVHTGVRVELEPGSESGGFPLVPVSDSVLAGQAVDVPKGEFWDESARFVGAVRPGNRTTWLDGWTRPMD